MCEIIVQLFILRCHIDGKITNNSDFQSLAMDTDLPALIHELDSSETIEVYHWIPLNKNKRTQEGSTFTAVINKWGRHGLPVWPHSGRTETPCRVWGWWTGSQGQCPPPAAACGTLRGCTRDPHRSPRPPDSWPVGDIHKVTVLDENNCTIYHKDKFHHKRSINNSFLFF